MIAVLFNDAKIRLGQKDVSEGTRVVKFGGAYFVRTTTQSKLTGDGWGIAFDQTLISVVCTLDEFNPRRALNAGQPPKIGEQLSLIPEDAE